MKIYNKLIDFQAKGNAVVTTGTFDGVHVGHIKIIKRLVEITKKIGGESVLLTFWPHPRVIVSNSNDDIKLLTTIDEKSEILAKLGIDHLVILPFTREFSELSSEQYIEDILTKGLGTKVLVIGYDHRFGKNRKRASGGRNRYQPSAPLGTGADTGRLGKRQGGARPAMATD